MRPAFAVRVGGTGSVRGTTWAVVGATGRNRVMSRQYVMKSTGPVRPPPASLMFNSPTSGSVKRPPGPTPGNVVGSGFGQRHLECRAVPQADVPQGERGVGPVDQGDLEGPRVQLGDRPERPRGADRRLVRCGGVDVTAGGDLDQPVGSRQEPARHVGVVEPVGPGGVRGRRRDQGRPVLASQLDHRAGEVRLGRVQPAVLVGIKIRLPLKEQSGRHVPTLQPLDGRARRTARHSLAAGFRERLIRKNSSSCGDWVVVSTQPLNSAPGRFRTELLKHRRGPR